MHQAPACTRNNRGFQDDLLLTWSFEGLCQRRQWPEPQYQAFYTPDGYKCVVRVNNREYHTDLGFHTEPLAVENAAQRAYLICRNFSMNDGMLPGSTPGSRRQGMPVAIGTERRSVHSDDGSFSGSSSGSRSGGSSPDRSDFPHGVGNAEHVPRRSKQSYSNTMYTSSRRR